MSLGVLWLKILYFVKKTFPARLETTLGVFCGVFCVHVIHEDHMVEMEFCRLISIKKLGFTQLFFPQSNNHFLQFSSFLPFIFLWMRWNIRSSWRNCIFYMNLIFFAAKMIQNILFHFEHFVQIL